METKKAKRIKRVFGNHEQVLHLWANEAQQDARCKNVFFNGKSCYSYGYHYELGRIVEYNGQKLFMVNDTGYSNTTAKHINSAWHAVENSLRLRTTDFNVKNSLLRQQDILIKELFDFFSQRVTYYKQYELTSWLGERVTEFNKTTIALGHKELTLDVNDDYKGLFKVHCILTKRRLEELKSPEALAKAEKDREKREAAKLAKIQVDIESWRRGSAKTIAMSNLNTVFLRVYGDEVQTSRGAAVPLTHALRLLRLIENGRVKQGEKVGHYSFNSIVGETIVIGCHRININEAKAVLSPYKTDDDKTLNDIRDRALNRAGLKFNV